MSSATRLSAPYRRLRHVRPTIDPPSLPCALQAEEEEGQAVNANVHDHGFEAGAPTASVKASSGATVADASLVADAAQQRVEEEARAVVLDKCEALVRLYGARGQVSRASASTCRRRARHGTCFYGVAFEVPECVPHVFPRVSCPSRPSRYPFCVVLHVYTETVPSKPLEPTTLAASLYLGCVWSLMGRADDGVGISQGDVRFPTDQAFAVDKLLEQMAEAGVQINARFLNSAMVRACRRFDRLR